MNLLKMQRTDCTRVPIIDRDALCVTNCIYLYIGSLIVNNKSNKIELVKKS